MPTTVAPSALTLNRPLGRYPPMKYLARHHLLALFLGIALAAPGCSDDSPSPTLTPVGDQGPDIAASDAAGGKDAAASDTVSADAADVSADVAVSVDTVASDVIEPDAVTQDTGAQDTINSEVVVDVAADVEGPDSALDATGSDAGQDQGPEVSADVVSADIPTDAPDASVDVGLEVPPVDLTDPGEPGTMAWTQEGGELSVPGGIFGAKVNLTVYVPDTAGPHPLVVFSHGFQLGPGDYTSYGQHLASWGFIAVLPAYPGSLIAPRTHIELKQDLVAVLDWAETAYTPTKIALAGHSMGGKISLLVATEDERPEAVFGIDPVDSGPPFTLTPQEYPSVTPELMPAITVPLVLLGETTDATGGLGGACAPADNNYEQYFEHADSPALRIDLLGAAHMSFLDNPSCGLPCAACNSGTDDPAQTRLLTRRYMTAFFLVVLQGETSFQSWLTGAEMQTDVGAGWVTTATANGYP